MRHGQVWRFITYAFLHANFVHVVVNIFSQIIIGSFIEATIGSLKTSILYLLTAYVFINFIMY
jgi:membrane associated rhomboid family serine protease